MDCDEDIENHCEDELINSDNEIEVEDDEESDFDEIEVDIDNSKLIYKGHEDAVMCVTLNNKGTCAISGSMDDKMSVWKVESGETLCSSLDIHEDTVNLVNISQSEKYFSSGDMSGNVIVWSIDKKGKLHDKYRIDMESEVVALEWVNENLICCNVEGTLQGWEANGSTLYVQGKGCCCKTMISVLNGDFIVVIYGGICESHENCGNQYFLTLVDLKNNSCYNESVGHYVNEYAGFGSCVTSTTTSSGASILAFGGQSQILLLTITPSNPQNFIKTPLPLNITSTIECLSFSDSNSWLSFGTCDGNCGVYDYTSNNVRGIWDGRTTGYSIVGMKWVPTLPIIVFVSEDAKIFVWDARNVEQGPLKILSGHRKIIWNFQITKPNTEGHYKIVTASEDHTCRVFEI